MIVALECGFSQAYNLLMTGKYISPSHTLQICTLKIVGEEKDYFYEGCIQAVVSFKKLQ